MTKKRIFILGLGDIGKRLAYSISLLQDCQPCALTIGSRNAAHGESFVRLLNGHNETPVRFVQVDGTDPQQLKKVIAQCEPDLIVQCASLLSPWHLHHYQSETNTKLLNAGFGLQLPAQLPVVVNLMRTLKKLNLDIPVVNVSFPDVVNPVLAAIGHPVVCGVGNSGMVQGLAAAELGINPFSSSLKVIAHHAHVGVSATNIKKQGLLMPLVYVNNEEEPQSRWFSAKHPIQMTSELNVLTASHATQIVCALLNPQRTLYTSVPGPQGLVGGWPVKITQGRVTLNLPETTDIATVNQYQKQYQRLDGIEEIDEDGVIYFTDEAKSAVADIDPYLSEPLHVDDCDNRLKRLMAIIESGK